MDLKALFNRRRLLPAAVVLVILLLLVWAFRPQPVIVDVAAVRRGPLAVTITEEGYTRVAERYAVTAPVNGQLQRIELEPGDAVSSGQTLAIIAPPATALLDPRSHTQAQAQLAEAEAALRRARALLASEQARLEQAESELARARKLAAERLLAAEQLERASTQASQARAGRAAAEEGVHMAERQRDAARANLERSLAADGEAVPVAAPAAGVVLKRLRESAGPVAVGEALLELGDPISLEVQTDLLTEQAVQLQAGMAVTLLRWGGDEPLRGRIERIEPAGFTKYSALGVEEQRVWVITTLDDNGPWRGRLGDGYRVETTFHVFEQPDALQVPTSALFREEGQWFVYVADGERARKRAVAPGRASGLWRAIESGLEAGETVVTHPGERLGEGAAIEVRGR